MRGLLPNIVLESYPLRQRDEVSCYQNFIIPIPKIQLNGDYTVHETNSQRYSGEPYSKLSESLFYELSFFLVSRLKVIKRFNDRFCDTLFCGWKEGREGGK